MVTPGIVILSLGLLALVNSSHKKHRDRCLISLLPYARSLPWLDAVGPLTPLDV